jgi:uncharacterized protein (DUF3084 family)
MEQMDQRLIDELRLDNERLKRELGHIRSQKETAQGEHDCIIKERDDFRRASAKHRAEAAQLRVEFATLSGELAAAQNDVDNLRSELADVKRQLSRALASQPRTLVCFNSIFQNNDYSIHSSGCYCHRC